MTTVVPGLSGTGVDVFVPSSLWSDACQLLEEPGDINIEEE